MSTSEQKITISVQLVKDRSDQDNRILQYKEESGINMSYALRNALYLWLVQQDKQQQFETDVLDGIKEIKSMLGEENVSVPPQPEAKKIYNNVFLDSES